MGVWEVLLDLVGRHAEVLEFRCLVWEESDNEWYGVEEIQWILRDAYLISGAAVTVTVTVT